MSMTFTNKTDYNIHGLVSVPHSEFFAFNLRIKRSSELKLSKEYINTNVIYARYGLIQNATPLMITVKLDCMANKTLCKMLVIPTTIVS